MSETEGTTPAPKGATPGLDELLEFTDDTIRVRRLPGVDDTMWSHLRHYITSELDDVVEQATGRCREYSWCTLAGVPEEHEKYHAGDITDLTGNLLADSNKRAGFWCWPVRDRPGGEKEIYFEGRAVDGADSAITPVPVRAVSWIMAATSTPEARAALIELLNEVDPG